MYIARASSKGRYDEDMSYKYPDLPILDGSIRERYIKAYPNDPLRAVQGSVGTMNQEIYTNFGRKRVIQRPWHDAESVVLMLLLFLLRCSPEDSEDESKDDLKEMQQMYTSIQNMPIGTFLDPRDNLFRLRRHGWPLYLHRDFGHLANYLSEICAAVFPDYEFLQPNTAINHEVVLHELLQRLLFKLYCEVKDSPNLDIKFKKEMRPLPVGEGWKQSIHPVAGSKSKFSSDIFYGVGDEVGMSDVESGPSSRNIRTSKPRGSQRKRAGMYLLALLRSFYLCGSSRAFRFTWTQAH